MFMQVKSFDCKKWQLGFSLGKHGFWAEPADSVVSSSCARSLLLLVEWHRGLQTGVPISDLFAIHSVSSALGINSFFFVCL